MKDQGHVATLRQWDEWGRAFVPTRTSRPNWSAVDLLIKAAMPRLKKDSSELRGLLKRSSGQLLSDPLLIDLGVHRWLDKETSYSDWLAWVIEQLGDPISVLTVFGLQDTPFASTCTGKVLVQREEELGQGSPGRKGRIDLLICFGEPVSSVLGVEVKIDDEQHEKQQGYAASLSSLGLPHKCVLVARDEKILPGQLRGFLPRKWWDVGIALRQAITRYARSHENHAVQAMMLAFVAAVEQNILKLGTSASRRAWQGKPVLLSRELAKYLRSLGGMLNENQKSTAK